MKHYALILFLIVKSYFLMAQQPAAAYIAADAQWVSSFQWSQWNQKTPASEWLRLAWVQQSLKSLQLNYLGARSISELHQVWNDPTQAGIDTVGFWHLASQRDSMGVVYYMLVMPMRQMGTWKTFIEHSLPRFAQSEFKIGSGHLYISRENMAWVWNRDRIMVWWYSLPEGVKYKPTYVQYKSLLETKLFPLLRISPAQSIYQHDLFRRSLEKTADLHLWANWGDSLVSAAQVSFANNGVLLSHQISLSPMAMAMLQNPPVWDAKTLKKLPNRSHNGLWWSVRFNPQGNQGLSELMRWVRQTPYFNRSNRLDTNIIASKIMLEAWTSLQGGVVGRLNKFILQTDSSLLPAFDVSIAHTNFKHIRAGLFELASKGYITATDSKKSLFEYKYTALWSWKIALDKKWLHLSMSDAPASAALPQLGDNELRLISENGQTIELDGNQFFAAWGEALPSTHRLQYVLKAMQLAINKYKLTAQKIDNQALYQSWELSLVGSNASAWANFMQLGNLFVSNAK